jgi:hypothetical protein
MRIYTLKYREIINDINNIKPTQPVDYTLNPAIPTPSGQAAGHLSN